MNLALTQKHTCRRLTGLGWLIATILFITIFIGFFTSLYPFLAPNHPPHEGLMVVEGWIDDHALESALEIYHAGNYSKIICTGVPLETGSYLLPFHSYSEMTADRLRQMGTDPAEIIVATGKIAQKDRTYLSAIALRDTLKRLNITETNIHLVTEGPHGRRSRLLFQKALGKKYKVGITCLPDPGYAPARWYADSQGVRKVNSEFIAYTYAKFIFHP
jgi:hypothetical protein